MSPKHADGPVSVSCPTCLPPCLRQTRIVLHSSHDNFNGEMEPKRGLYCCLGYHFHFPFSISPGGRGKNSIWPPGVPIRSVRFSRFKLSLWGNRHLYPGLIGIVSNMCSPLVCLPEVYCTILPRSVEILCISAGMYLRTVKQCG